MKYEKSFYENFYKHSHTISIFKEHLIITIVMEKKSFAIHDNLLLERIFDIFWLTFYSRPNADFDVVTDFVAKFSFSFMTTGITRSASQKSC